mmetsp:Transcript_30290/g.63478  ORF Transcript_30290/g.63478 Transcript_30290/m.63478 type:complete len:777 (+) Transcript_30290:215-2545(+)
MTKQGGSSNPRQRKPVLIIPGFMSSALTIEKSSIDPTWEGKRLWLNLFSLGFHSLQIGGVLRKNEDQIRKMEEANKMIDSKVGRNNGTLGASVKSSRDLHLEYLKQVECKSKWVEHIRLQPDMIHENEGVVVRPIPGTAGVDYLTPGALTENMSYVFGPVLKLLQSVGYKNGIDLDAAPYDWRIPPSELQSRDQYFTNTMKTIEQLYYQSNDTPVVILCHSMGCKTAHYLFNFVLKQLGAISGQSWLNKHIDAYVPVGAPHVGAPKTIRAMMVGDKMGLDAFLEDVEGLVLGRSLGSVPWLFPLNAVQGKKALSVSIPQDTIAPQVEVENFDIPPAPSCPIVVPRHESSLNISLPSQLFRLDKFVQRRKTLPTKLRLAIVIGKNLTMRTSYYPVTNGRNKLSATINFGDEMIVIACPPKAEDTLQLYPSIQVRIEEPGRGAPAHRKKGIFDFDLFWPIRCMFCLLRWIFCLPCTILFGFGGVMADVFKKGSSEGAALLGSTIVIGESDIIDWRKRWSGYKKSKQIKLMEEGGGQWLDLEVAIEPKVVFRYGFFMQKPSPQILALKFQWKPSPTARSGTHSTLSLRNQTAKGIIYHDSEVNYLLAAEGLSHVQKILSETYGRDPIGPRSLSSFCPPPIKKVISIFGVNLPTEVGAIYQRTPSVHRSIQNALKRPPALYKVDEDAILDRNVPKRHQVSNGLILETKNTPQSIYGSNISVMKSGDGTVPYQSLQQCRMWQGKGVAKCDVTVHEIDGAEHRAILNDARFHKILLIILGFE